MTAQPYTKEFPPAIKARTERLAALFNRSSRMTSQEIFTADFGHWPPNGLNPEPLPQEKIRLRSMYNIFGIARRQLSYKMNRAAARPEDRLLFKAARYALYAPIYICHLHENYKSLMQNKDKRMAYIDLGQTGRNIHVNRSKALRKLGIPVGEMFAHEHIHIRQYDRQEKGEISVEPLIEGLIDDRAKSAPKYQAEYYGSAFEIQARLHALIAHSYAETQKLPETRMELWRIARDAGLMLPLHIAFSLDADKEEPVMPKPVGERAKDGEEVSHDIRELQFISSTLVKPEMNKKFWQETIPALYANLLELYGDKKAAEKFLAEPMPEILARVEAVMDELRHMPEFPRAGAPAQPSL